MTPHTHPHDGPPPDMPGRAIMLAVCGSMVLAVALLVALVWLVAT